MKKKRVDTREVAYLALGVATMIAGGFAILQLSMIFPIPGTKYIFMAPFLSMIFLIILSRLRKGFGLIKLGTVFGLIMLIINLYMGVTIILTAILSQITALFISQKNRNFWGSVFFSCYTGICALTVSKYFVGGVFKELSLIWIIVTGTVCFAFGLLGALYAKRIIGHLPKQTFEV